MSDLTAEHEAFLAAQGITAEAAGRRGIHSARSVDELPAHLQHHGPAAVPAIVFPWVEPGGEVKYQIRPDVPIVLPGEERPAKYLFGPGQHGARLGCFRRWPAPRAEVIRALIVEGTKQAVVAAEYAPDGWDVYGIAGCRNWSEDGVPTPHLAVLAGCDVVVMLDADAASNAEVFDAGQRLAEALHAEGATSVRFARLPGGRKAGLDDILGARPAHARAGYLARLIEAAKAKPADRKPAPRSTFSSPDRGPVSGPDRFFDSSGLLVQDLSEAVRDGHPAALTAERRIALYRDGVYNIDGAGFIGVMAGMLGNRYRPSHRAAVEEFTIGILHTAGLLLPTYVDQAVLNCRNGMLDLATGTLKPHDPVYLSSTQIPVAWDPDATAPRYEEWLDAAVGSQMDDLEEVASTMLDPSRTPPKAVFLFGPSRSGKSTFLRLLQAMAGADNYSAVTLHQLAADRFAAANVFGKMLNCAADLSSAHVEDISAFKMMTGEDPTQANRKYGNQFSFINRALFAFSANELPTVGESSRAYVERIKPVAFPHSFAGREDPRVEQGVIGELPGILARWVRAYQRMLARGSYLPTDERVLLEFETRSDRVKQWLHEECQIWPAKPGSLMAEATPRRELARLFNVWAERNGGARMGERKIIDRLLGVAGVVDVRRRPDKAPALNITERNHETFTAGPETFTASLETFTAEPLVKVSGGPVKVSGEQTFTESSQGTPMSVKEVKVSNEKLPASPHTHIPTRARVTESEGAGEKVCVTPTEKFSGETFTAPQDRNAPEYPQVTQTVTSAGRSIPPGVVVLDLETGSSDAMWSAGPDYIRLVGAQIGDRICTVPVGPDSEIVPGGIPAMVVGHNLMGFDLPVLARLREWDMHTLAREGRLIDTMLTEVVNNPPPGGMRPEQVIREYSLDSLAAARFGEGKSDALKRLAKQFGGFDRIPVDHADYHAYLARDVDLTARLAGTQPRTEYAIREHRVAAIAAQIRWNGFRVDTGLLATRVAAGAIRRAELVDWLRTQVDLPTTNKAGKPVKSPQATDEGREAIAAAFRALGVRLHATKAGKPSLGKDDLTDMALAYPNRPDVLQLIEALQALNGVRTVYDTVTQYLQGDRVHPEISMYQASGRWSITRPGLTVMGKRGERWREREVFLPEPGHVVISADLSQVDARAVAAWCQDDAYLDLFAPGRDSHTEIAVAVWGDPGRRQDAKIVGHGWNYNMGLRTLAQHAGSEQTAREFDQAMRQRFPKLIAWKREVVDRASSGELLDNGFGRKMRCTPGREYTQAPALMGQGTARDLMMEGLLRLPSYVLPMLRAVVHDEIVLSIPEADAADIERDVLAALSFEWAPPGARRSVQIEAGLGERRGRNWGHVYEHA